MPFVQVKNLKKEHLLKKGKVLRSIDDVSFTIFKGETLGLVGESGCGKSSIARCLLRLDEPTSGEILIEGKNLLSFSASELLQFRRQAQMIFQDPYASLNPRMTAADNIAEPLRIHRLYPESEMRKQTAILFDLVGLSQSFMDRYPHEFSGGQRQRIAIARALALRPSLLICDEPISALDVSVQAQIVNLLKSLQKELGLTYLFIAHDLAMVKYISDRVAVMHQGQLVELAETEEIYAKPRHSYTQQLLKS